LLKGGQGGSLVEGGLGLGGAEVGAGKRGGGCLWEGESFSPRKSRVSPVGGGSASAGCRGEEAPFQSMSPLQTVGGKQVPAGVDRGRRGKGKRGLI